MARIDGTALAIELVARRVDAFGVGGVAARLDDRFRLLTSGRRTALPRHQTLSAALDWSYEFLPRTERAMLRRLAIFSGGFTLEMASAVAADASSSAPEIVDGVASLVAKLLIAADVSGATPSTAWRCWSARRPSGWPATAARSTTCVWPSTGRSRPPATPRSACA